ncbi:hypothetical protein TVAG_475580 [Trichomonas vaginalis G3]|uniref:Uncharacterized protein n=1 Tax=Trichomonas vaginalis (strain ATCC PRA-98 / G3) TaxID=412133 RepID=A2D9Y2_TRIV3|nr:leucine-rich repeats (6 copies)-containing protein [Trichomonas vaginalis G3]EAY22630.1 hypothetical protein TVAG_475580 [Trichomonas vaginalis G3]KAI5525444.1 leucine-rich repeats (6 copies)-containing protein [Trichomonas vaginalis G3]|eukprot:XP_001583616.1 hypothetical protein [Trichomonas vaginalis G3]
MTIDPSAFDYADISLKVEKDNPYFTISGNCLIERNSGNLILTFGNLPKVYTIPKEVKKIGGTSIRAWTDAAQVNSISFYNTNLGAPVIKIPDSVISIDKQAFLPDVFLYTVCYDGFVYSPEVEDVAQPLLTNAYVTDKYPYHKLLGLTSVKSCSTKLPREYRARHIIGLSIPEIVLIVLVVLLIIILIVSIILIRMKLPKAGDKTIFQSIN